MKRISTRAIFISKWVFPIVWFGILAVIFVAALLGDKTKSDPMVIAMPLIMAAFGFFIIKHFVWNLADEVLDYGDYLLVRKGGEEDRIPLSNIMNVSSTVATNPKRITLRLLKPGKFGPNVHFSPPGRFTLNPFAPNPVAEDLMMRAHRARDPKAS
jgi:hypothetical protein